jgi:hypothetical protein
LLRTFGEGEEWGEVVGVSIPEEFIDNAKAIKYLHMHSWG